jgi:hypothetical protein
MNTKQLSKLACAIMLVFSMIACKKEGLVTTDNIKPKMQLHIQGNGVNKIFYSDSTDYFNTGTLYLQHNASYTFELVIGDDGGVNLLQATVDTNAFRFQTITASPELSRFPTFTEIGSYTINGDRSNPYRSFIISGRFIANNPNQDDEIFSFVSVGSDYTPNIVGLTIPCIINSQTPNGFGWKEL